MPEIKFLPSGQIVEVPEKTKVLIAAIRNKVKIRYGCAACQCGTCAVRILPSDALLVPMEEDEAKLLARMQLTTDGSIRLACRAKVLQGQALVDLDFQSQYSPADPDSALPFD